MIKKSKILLAEKYDISQKILKELVNFESRHILFAIIKHPKTIQEISDEEKIPLSSAYKRITSLKECSLVNEKADFSESGHITKYYQSKSKMLKSALQNLSLKLGLQKIK